MEEIRIDNEEEARRAQKPVILFLVFLAIMTGSILTSVALGVFGNVPLLAHTIPVAIFLICIIPLIVLYKKIKRDGNNLQQS